MSATLWAATDAAHNFGDLQSVVGRGKLRPHVHQADDGEAPLQRRWCDAGFGMRSNVKSHVSESYRLLFALLATVSEVEIKRESQTLPSI
jgi:hypothetical protein